MGLLTVGLPLSWKDSQRYIEYIKKHGIEQFINLYNHYRNKCCDTFKWGDELEYILAIVPPKERTVLLSLRSKEIRAQCKANIADDVKADTFDKAIIHPEYGCFMIEGIICTNNITIMYKIYAQKNQQQLHWNHTMTQHVIFC